MTIKQQGGIFGRNPTFNDLTAGSGSSIEGSGDNVTFSVDRTDASTAGALVLRASNGSLSIDSDGADKDILIRTGGSTERARFYGDSGNFSIKGNLIVDSGQGIDFSATSGTGTSELFDDYEEGTWTPVPADAASGGNTGSATTAVGHYTKVGRVVTVAVDLYNINKTALTATNPFFLQGLPFTAASITGSMQFTGISSGGSTFGGSVIGPVVYDANAAIRFFDPTGTITDRYLVSDVSANADIRFSLTYFA